MDTQQKPVKPKKNYNIRQYFQGIICDRDTRESGKKRNFWTNIILVILIISIVLLIVCITLVLNANDNWWVYLIFGLLGFIGCMIGHYYNTKTYIENSKYDIDIDDIAAFIDIKNAIKKTINTISQNQKEIDDLNRQINIIIGKNKAKALTSSIASSTSKGFSSLADKSKSGFSSLRNKMKPTNTIVPATTQPLDATNSPSTTTTSPSMAAAANEFYVGGDDDLPVLEDPNKLSVLEDPQLKTLKEKLNEAKTNLESNKDKLNNQMIEYNKLKIINDIYKELITSNKENLNIIYNIKDFYDEIKLLDNTKSIDIAKLNSLNKNEQKIFNEKEQKIFDEYNQIMYDIQTIKSLNTKSEDISIIIQNINSLTLKLPYLQTIKNSMLANYMEKFITYMDNLLIESKIDEYFTISTKYIRIVNNLNDINKNHVTDNYTKKLPLLKEKYTKISINLLEELKKTISLTSYDPNLFTELYNKYKEFVDKKDILDNEKIIDAYNNIKTELLNGYVKYVTNIIDPESNVLTQKTKVEPLHLFIESVEDKSKAPGIQKTIDKYKSHPLLIGQDELYLKTAILIPYKEKLATLEKAKALAESSSDNFILQGVTNVFGLNKK